MQYFVQIADFVGSVSSTPQHWRALSVSLTPLRRANDELGVFTHETTPPNVAGTLSSLVAFAE